MPPNQEVWNLRAIIAAGGDAALAFIPGGHNESFPVETPPAGAVAAYLDELSVAWMDCHVKGDGSRRAQQGFSTVSLYQQQYPDIRNELAMSRYPA